jgi:predicted MPP superfamily phosphohydrolase
VHLSDIPPRRSKSPKIEVRRFAGPGIHAEQLQHLRVAHLTDLHFGRVTPMAVQEAAVALTNASEPDLVVVTGDLVCHSQLYLDELIATLQRIQAPVVAVLGNHDYWSGAREVAWALGKAGALLLQNQNTTLELRGQKLQVVGLDDPYTGHADRASATKGLQKNVATLGLSHVAEEADGLWAAGVPLVLSGHTHAGQVTFARLHELTLGRLAGHRYVHGLYGARRPAPEGPPGAVYVSAGIGASVMPIRIGERGRREVAIFELGREVPAFPEHHDEQPPLAGRKPSPKLVDKRKAAVILKMYKRELREAKAALKNGGQGPD